MADVGGVCSLYEVKERLRFALYELEKLMQIGIIAPVGRFDSRGRYSGGPLFSVAAVEKLATPEERGRIQEALWEDFQPHPQRLNARGRPWAPPTGAPPCYPFDSDKQRAWAKELYEKRVEATLPTIHAMRIKRVKQQNEALATKAFAKAHPKKRLGYESVRWPLRRKVSLSRIEIRDLVWSKTMIRAAADLKMSEFTLRRLCKVLLIPTPPRGHFNHHRAADRVPRPRLLPLKRRGPS
jgi:hypothetical protein